MSSRSGTVEDMVSLTNRLESKVIVVTGGSSGIGVAGLTRAAAL